MGAGDAGGSGPNIAMIQSLSGFAKTGDGDTGPGSGLSSDGVFHYFKQLFGGGVDVSSLVFDLQRSNILSWLFFSEFILTINFFSEKKNVSILGLPSLFSDSQGGGDDSGSSGGDMSNNDYDYPKVNQQPDSDYYPNTDQLVGNSGGKQWRDDAEFAGNQEDYAAVSDKQFTQWLNQHYQGESAHLIKRG